MESLRVGHDWATSLSRIGEGNGNPLRCSCLENPRDRGAWWTAVYGVAQSWTWLNWLSSSSSSRPEWKHFILLSFLSTFWIKSFLENFIELAVLDLCCCVRAFSSCSSQALGVKAWLPCAIWNLPGSGIEPISPTCIGHSPWDLQGSAIMSFNGQNF